MGPVQRIDTHVLQLLAFRTDIAVLFRQVGELLDPIEIALPQRIFFDPDIRGDTAIVEPLQQFTVAVGVVGRQTLRPAAITFAIAIRCAFICRQAASSSLIFFRIVAHCSGSFTIAERTRVWAS